MKRILLMLAAALLLPLGIKAGEVHIVVSIRQQTAWLVGEDGHIMMESPVATGKRSGGKHPGIPTPTGHFHIGEKYLLHHSSEDYSWIMRYYMKFAGEPFGMHQYYMPYISRDGYFGARASHGCIRMPMAQAVFFYNHVHIGTPVTILPN